MKVRGKEIGKGEEANAYLENPIFNKMKLVMMKRCVFC